MAAFAEISGCYSFWAWLRLGKSIFWVIPGIFVLIIFAVNLTPRTPSLPGKGGFKASPRRGERFGEGFIYTLKTPLLVFYLHLTHEIFP
ncbi:YnfA family protein [Dolichospermum compactum]|uniref:hypothetical protein n=1 Tax=Dolichospermum compactum TaxID=136073 RepID=UPI000BBB7A20|nr:hypothetical protein [Dolichospermum compactum]